MHRPQNDCCAYEDWEYYYYYEEHEDDEMSCGGGLRPSTAKANTNLTFTDDQFEKWGYAYYDNEAY